MKRFLLLLLLSVPVFLLAQSAMSLDDCIRLAYKQNPTVRNGVIGIKETKADYIASVGAFLPHIVVNAETGKRFGRSLDPDTNGYTSESFEEGTVGLDMTLSLFEGFSRINQVRFRKMNKERSEWELKEKQNELTAALGSLADAGRATVLDKMPKLTLPSIASKPRNEEEVQNG